MARKLEDVLKTRGYTDAEIEELKPLLANAKFRGTLEAELLAGDEVAGDRDKFKTEAEEWAAWHKDTALPTLERAMKAEQVRILSASGSISLPKLVIRLRSRAILPSK